MKRFVTAVLLACLFAATPAIAGNATPESTVLDAARIISATRVEQKAFCMQPRTNSSERCNADFETYYFLLTQHAAWQIIHLSANSNLNLAKRKEYEREWKDAKDKSVASSSYIVRTYYPLTKTGMIEKK